MRLLHKLGFLPARPVQQQERRNFLPAVMPSFPRHWLFSFSPLLVNIRIHTYTDGGEEERRGNRKDRFYLFISFSISFSVSFSFSFSLSLMSRLMSPFGRSFVCLPSPIPVAIFTYYTLNLFCSVLSCECVCYGRVLSHRNRTTNYR